jgi:HlyD family secretion protein
MHGTMAAPMIDAGAERSARMRRRLLWAGLLLLFAAIAAYAVFKRPHGKTLAGATAVFAPPPVVTVIVPGRAAVAAEVRLTGSIAARRASPVGVQGEGGMITAVLVKEGDFVGRGQVLARIDRAVQDQQMLQMAASIRQAQADAALAQAELDRAQALVTRGFISKADIDRKTATRDGALAKVSLARAQSGEMRARLARLDVRSPTAGIILARAVEAGQVVGAGSPALFTLAEDGAMEMRARVAEQDMAQLRLGQDAKVNLVGTESSFSGHIWLIDPVVDPQARQGLVRIALGRDPRLRPGAFATATVRAGEVVRPQLPQSAVQSDEKGNFVMIVGNGDMVEQRRVEVGDVTAAGVAIAKGLTGQERIVANAAAFVQPGEKVAPVVRSVDRG